MVNKVTKQCFLWKSLMCALSRGLSDRRRSSSPRPACWGQKGRDWSEDSALDPRLESGLHLGFYCTDGNYRDFKYTEVQGLCTTGQNCSCSCSLFYWPHWFFLFCFAEPKISVFIIFNFTFFMFLFIDILCMKTKYMYIIFASALDQIRLKKKGNKTYSQREIDLLSLLCHELWPILI